MAKAVERVIWLVERIVMTMLAITVVIVFVQVFARYALRSPITWTEQISRFLFMWMVLLGVPVIFHRRIIISFDLLVKCFPRVLQIGVDYLCKAAICVYSAFYFWKGVDFCIQTAGDMTSGLVFPIAYLYVAQPVSAFLLFVVILNQIIIDSKALSKGKGGSEKCCS